MLQLKILCASVKENRSYLRGKNWIVPALDLNKCLKQIKLPRSLQSSASISEIPSNKSTMIRRGKFPFSDNTNVNYCFYSLSLPLFARVEHAYQTNYFLCRGGHEGGQRFWWEPMWSSRGSQGPWQYIIVLFPKPNVFNMNFDKT